MSPDITLSPLRGLPPTVGFPVQRSPVLVLEQPDGGAAPPRLAPMMARRSLHAVVQAGQGPAPIGPGPAWVSPAMAAWRRLQGQFHTACVGLVAGPGAAIGEASRVLAACWDEGTGPGAIALLGFGPDLPATCLELAGRALPGQREWPAMMVFLPADDAGVGDCALACRRMRSAGISIRLEVMRPMPATASGSAAEEAVGELVDELDGFFSAHLIPCFPKLF